MKKALSIITLICVCLSAVTILAACDEGHTHSFKTEWAGNETAHWHECEGEGCVEISDKADHTWVDGEGAKVCSVCGKTQGAPVENAGMSEQKWNEMIAPTNFENYTLTMVGNMTVTVDGVVEAEGTDAHSRNKFADGKMSIELFDEHGAFEGEPIIVEGEMAELQAKDTSQVFLIMLKECKNFKFDADTNTYKIENEITIETTLTALAFDPEGSMTTMDVPTVIIMKEAEVTVSPEGALLSLKCDYSQTMDMNGKSLKTEGLTTWTFSDYGTTVIE